MLPVVDEIVAGLLGGVVGALLTFGLGVVTFWRGWFLDKRSREEAAKVAARRLLLAAMKSRGHLRNAARGGRLWPASVDLELDVWETNTPVVAQFLGPQEWEEVSGALLAAQPSGGIRRGCPRGLR